MLYVLFGAPKVFPSFIYNAEKLLCLTSVKLIWVKKIKKSFIILLSVFVALLASSASVQAKIPQIKPENADVNITIETLPDGRCYIMVTVDVSVTLPEAALDKLSLAESAMLSAATPEMINLVLAIYFEGKNLSELMGMAGQKVEIPPR